MADTNGGDVERHFLELAAQLQEDGFDSDSLVMKTTERLRKALRHDGFAFAETETEPRAVAESAAPASEPAAPKKRGRPKSVLRAFRTKDVFDTTVVTAVFASIDGWTTRAVQHGNHHFVVATNGKSITDDHVKKALGEYVEEVRASSPPA